MTDNKIRNLISFFLGILFFTSTISCQLLMRMDIVNNTAGVLYFYAVFCLITINLVLLLLKKKHHFTLRLSLIDFILLMYWLWTFIRLISTREFIWPAEEFICFSLLIILLIVFKYCVHDVNSKNTVFILSAFMACGATQAIYGILQLYEIGTFKTNQLFKTIGFFENPDPYAGFLASIIPFAFGLYLLIPKGCAEYRFLKYAGLITALSGIFILPATLERSSWLAVSTGCVSVCFAKYNIYTKIKKITSKRNTKLIWSAGLLLGVFLILLGLYSVKPQSANGRILMWKITAQMIKNNPIIGMGYNRFQVEYDDFESKYFADGKGTQDEERLADNIYHAHNEFLQVWSELGLIGLILFGALVIISIKYSNYYLQNVSVNPSELLKKAITVSAGASLAAIAVSSLFSFPTHIFPTYINLIFIFSLISAYSLKNQFLIITIKNYYFKAVSIPLAILVVALLSSHTYNAYNMYREWQSAYDSTQNMDLTESEFMYRKIYPYFRNNGRFLFMYGGVLSLEKKYKEAIPLLEAAKTTYNDTHLWITLGQSYDGLDINEVAEGYYKKAANIIPHKFYPKYLLTKLWMKTGQKEKAFELGSKILNMEEKVHSLAIQEMKEDIEKMISTLHNISTDGPLHTESN